MALDPKIVKRNSNEFSVTKEAIKEAVNSDFTSGEQDFYNVISYGKPDTKESYMWTAMSAIADDIGEILYEKVLNFIDDVSDIDTCSIKSLKSMAQALGTDHAAFNTIKDAPLEILNLLDVFTIRKDYLLNSQKVCRQLEKTLNRSIREQHDKGIIDNICSAMNGDILSDLNKEEIRPLSAFERLSAADFIEIGALDSVISSTYYDVLLSHVSQRYNTVSNELIYEVLSNEILCSDFAIPNKYAEDIYAAKVRWNIPAEFDQSAEADKIDSGISSKDSYSQYEQKILDIEYKRRSDPRREIENKSRYSYYREADVRDYFRFIQNKYSSASQSYSNAAEYDLDTNYLEIIGLSAQQQLLSAKDGNLAIDLTMVSEVAMQLLGITSTIRGIREYLKSQAQRNYMKGTYLLISYCINEYLKNNVYPALSKLGVKVEDYPISQNQLKLTEYIDQTNYNNIETDIKEDIGKSDLNPQFWLGTGAEGNADSLDTTNIFRPEDKSKVNSIRTFTQDQIADFYFNVLGSFKNVDKLLAADVNGTLNSFLSSIFSVGADNSWLDEHGKVMCELPNTTVTTSADEYLRERKFTIDQDQHVYDVKEAFDSSQYVLSGFVPTENTTVQSQLDDALAAFKSTTQDVYSDDLNSALSRVQGTIDDTQSQINKFNSFDETFSSITTQYSNLTASYLQYTGDFSASTSQYFVNQLAHYSELVNYKFSFKSKNIRDTLQVQIAQIATQYNALMHEVQQFVQSYVVSTDLNASYHFIDNPPKLNVNLRYSTQKLSSYISESEEQQWIYELVRSSAVNALTTALTTLTTKKLTVESNGQDKISKHLTTAHYKEFDQLSLLLSSQYQETFNIMSCVEVLSLKLDYESTSWYKYKKTLFSKYIGLSVGDTPYYYLENITHPSYQIHPCLSNFIENLDFSYPVKGLAGIAKGTIEYIVKNNTTLCVDTNGYLLSVWNNPLNGNGDYLTRYEKTDHTDALNNDNCLYGYDGPFYIAATNHLELEKAAESLASQESINSSWYRGLNITDLERRQIKVKLNEFKSVISSIAADFDAEIVRYGLDAYENSYTLIKSSSFCSGSPILWMRKKNHPYAFPALAYKKYGSDYVPDNEHSQIQFDKTASNSFFSQVNMAQRTDRYFPVIYDFIFSKDKTTAIFLCESSDSSTYWPIHANVTQEYIRNETYDSYVQHFEFDKDTGTEHCLSATINDCKLTSFYVNKNDVGILYAQDIGQEDSLCVMIDTYLKGDRGKYQDSTISGIVKTGTSAKIDVQKDGSFSIAYVGPAAPTGKFETYQQFNELSYSSDYLTKYINTHNRQIKACDYQVIGNQIDLKAERAYLPYVEMGFIPLFKTAGQNTTHLSGTSLQNDLDDGKPMKFEMFCTEADKDAGIDFKFVCPIRSIESSQSTYVDQSYHRDSTIGLACYSFTDMHYLESRYNKYVREYDDATFWDHTEFERDIYLSTRLPAHDVFDDYMKLAKYDVQQYLSVLRSEDRIPIYDPNDLDNNSYIEIGSEEMEYVAQPYLVSRSVLATGNLSTYVNGYYDGTRSISPGQCVIKLDDGDISVSWLLNDINTIKLDFNAQYYCTKDDNVQSSNVRNKLHLFLNLDRPGDSGYLTIYEDGGTSKISYSLFIKNISDKTRPRFVMKKLNIDKTQNTDNLVSVTAAAFKAQQGVISVPLLAEEGFASRYVVFE